MLLALDTSGPALRVGLFEGGDPLHVWSEEIGRGHAEAIRPAVERAFAAAGATPSQLARIAVTRGPGSFTGLRVGLAFARGLALATGAEALGVGTLAVLGAQVVHKGEYVVVTDARRGEVFAQAFRDGVATGELRRIALDGPWPFGDTAVTGPGAGLIEGAARIAARTEGADDLDLATLARLGHSLDAGRHPPSPLYGRGADAKVQSVPFAQQFGAKAP